MTREEILENIREIIEKQQNQSWEIDEKTRLGTMVGVNCVTLSSLEYVELITEIENKFNVIIDFDVDLYVVSDVIDYIVEYTNVDNENPLCTKGDSYV